MSVKTINLSRLTKLELIDLANSVIKLVEEHEPETLKLKEAFDLLVDKQPQIDYLEVRFGPHPLTYQLNGLRHKRNVYATVISLQMKVLSKMNIDGTDRRVKNTELVVNRFLHNLRANNEKTISAKLSKFFQEIEENASLEADFETLGMTEHIDELQSVQSTIMEIADERYDSISARPRGKSRPIEQSIRSALSHLVRQINLAKKQYPEISYDGLIEKLNVRLISFENLINTRATLLKKKKAEQTVDDEVVDEPVIENEGEVENDPIIDDETDESDDPDDPIETTQFAGRMMHMNAETVNVNGNGFENGELDEKKTAAQSTKQLQLPIIEERGTNM